MAAPASKPAPPGGGLNVIALVSGGKDSFFSLLHCIANGHRVVALANLHPPPPAGKASPAALVTRILPADDAAPYALRGWEGGEEPEEEDPDLNSFMYQTVGHQVVPFYAAATGIPLYRRPIMGGAVQHGRDYAHRGAHHGDSGEGEEDETESMVPLLRAVMAAHPEADALSAGAILSTYQRTRVESVAVRLGLTPLAFLWKFPVLPTPAATASSSAGRDSDGARRTRERLGLSSAAESGGGEDDDGQLLRDMAAAGLEARVVKVSSGGLDESFLWENVASEDGLARVRRAMRRFGAAESGAVLGEGGEFETLVVGGPRALFRGRVAVGDGDRRVVREGGGSAWLAIRRVAVEAKPEEEEEAVSVRIPDWFDERFWRMLCDQYPVPDAPSVARTATVPEMESSWAALEDTPQQRVDGRLLHWVMVADQEMRSSIEEETQSVVHKILSAALAKQMPMSSIINTAVVLRRMADFPAVNKSYGTLFKQPNPPSRVTISCGDLLPAGCNIMVSLTAHDDLRPDARQGLHVQSRSYWAPANIGPYSQSVTIPLASLFSNPHGADSSQNDAPSGPRLVSIAGQIPLVPGTMALPDKPDPSSPGTPDGFDIQLVLALQHLWRIGIEMGVQWWSSAVAYVPRTGEGSSITVRDKAARAMRAWASANLWATGSDDSEAEDDSDAEGPDLWDRKYNPQYMSFEAGGGDTAASQLLPDWSVHYSRTREPQPPPCFLAEVEELPRQAGVEWHAHLGFSHLSRGQLRTCSASGSRSDGGWEYRTWNTRVRSDRGVLLHTALAVSSPRRTGGEKWEARSISGLVGELASMLREANGGGGGCLGEEGGPLLLLPELLYVNAAVIPWPPPSERDDAHPACPVIPCHSLWGGKGDEELAAVAVYRNTLQAAGSSTAEPPLR